VLDLLFHALVRWMSPVLVFTAEEVWSTRFPDAGSVHLLDWPELPELCSNEGESPTFDSWFHGNGAEVRWSRLRDMRAKVTEAIEPLRREKIIGSSLEAEVTLPEPDLDPAFLAELFITSTVRQGEWAVTKTDNHKCGRCWRHLPEVPEDGALCRR